MFTLRASFTLQFSIHTMIRQALLKCLQKNYEQWFRGAKQLTLSDWTWTSLSYLWLCPLGTLTPSFTASGVTGEWMQRRPLPQRFLSCAPAQSFLSPASPGMVSYLLAGVSRSDQSTGGSWMRNWSCTQKAIPLLPVASGICQTSTPLKCLEPLHWRPFKMKFYQISLHSHLPLNLMNVTRWQQCQVRQVQDGLKKKKNNSASFSLLHTVRKGPWLDVWV